MRIKELYKIHKITSATVESMQLGAFSALPFEVVLYICSLLDPSGLENLALLNKQFHKLSSQLWEDLVLLT